jgi:hypothetical protein
MKLSDTIACLLDQPIPQPDQFTKFCKDRLRDRGGWRTFLRRKPGNQHRIDAVRLRPRQIFGGKSMGPQRIEQRHGKAFRDEIRKEILPVMPCGLHRDHRVGGVPHECSQLPIALGIFLEGCGRHQHGPIFPYDRTDMPLRSNINPHKPHSPPL